MTIDGGLPEQQPLPEVSAGRTDFDVLRQMVTESSSRVSKVRDGCGLWGTNVFTFLLSMH